MKNIVFCFLILNWVVAVASPGPVNAQDNDSNMIKNQLFDLQEQIIAISDDHSDKDFEFRRHLFRVTMTLIQNQIDDAQKSGNLERVNALKAEMVSLPKEMYATWDNHSALEDLECKKAKLLQDLKIVQLKIVKNKLADLDPKRTEEIDQTIAAIEKSKTLIDQRYELQKELSQAREVEDFKTADTIYQKLKDVRSQQKDIEAETTKQIMQTEEKSPAEESLNL
ncbi:MAG TPA: hypothetical protein VN963_04120 [bacterium]|nr:hypothetical protein [bacterium]